MNPEILKRRFAEIGAEIEIARKGTHLNNWAKSLATEFDLDIVGDGKNEKFFLNVRTDVWDEMEFSVPNLEKDIRHLLLVARKPADHKFEKQKFLCGHDERHWFVAGINGKSVSNIGEAMDSLKPQLAANSQKSHGVKSKDWHKRHNAGFVRQGEWFFIPRPQFNPGKDFVIFRNEPLQRNGGSKPHIVSEMVRNGGSEVYSHYRSGDLITVEAFEARRNRNPNFRPGEWTLRRANPRVFVRGTVRHADHYTIHLGCWHEVAMNLEPVSSFVAFLD